MRVVEERCYEARVRVSEVDKKSPIVHHIENEVAATTGVEQLEVLHVREKVALNNRSCKAIV